MLGKLKAHPRSETDAENGDLWRSARGHDLGDCLRRFPNRGLPVEPGAFLEVGAKAGRAGIIDDEQVKTCINNGSIGTAISEVVELMAVRATVKTDDELLATRRPSGEIWISAQLLVALASAGTAGWASSAVRLPVAGSIR